MTYEEFEIDYLQAFKTMMQYKPNEVGAQVYAEKMSSLSDSYPDFANKMEEVE